MDIMTGENFCQFRLLTLTSFIGEFVHSETVNWIDKIISILASYKFHFKRVHENLV